MKKYLILLLGVLLIPGTLWCYVTIDADNSNIQYIGRVDFTNSKKPAFDWSGTQISAMFSGTSCKVRLQDYAGHNYFNVFIDNAMEPLVIFPNTSSAIDVTVTQGLTDTTHTILVTRRNEASLGKTQFLGFILDDGKTLQSLPSRPNRRMEFIGDSITCGFGNMATSTETYKNSTENNYLTWGPMTARSLNADYHVIAWSGKGVVRNYNDSSSTSTDPLPNFYERTCGSVATNNWNFSWQPHVVAIHLGTNDFSTSPNPSQTTFENGYLQFIQKIRSKYSEAHIICVYSTWIKSVAKPYIQNVVTQSGDTKVHFADLGVTFSNPADYGASGHPNVSGHQKMANALVPIITNINPWGSVPVNQSPNPPSKPVGVSSGVVNVSYNFSTSATDPDNDQLKYGWDWNGDNVVDEWSNLGSSGRIDSRPHSWSQAGTYNIKVKSQDSNNAESSWSTVLVVNLSVQTDVTPPSAVTDLKAEGKWETEDGRIRLSWTSPGDDGTIGQIVNGKWRIAYSTVTDYGLQITDYKIEITTTVNSSFVICHLLSGLNYGTTYYFKLWSSDENQNWSGISNTATGYAQDLAPPSPTGFNAVVSGKNISLYWDAVSAGDINHYKVYYDNDTSGKPYTGKGITAGDSPINVGNVTNYILSLTAAGTYYLTVTAVDNNGNESGFSTEKIGVIPADNQPPITPVPTEPAKNYVLTPDGDGKNDTITFSVSGGSSMKIFDLNGRVIRDLESNQWDGKDNSGNLVKSGLYIYHITNDNGQLFTGTIVIRK